ncbi:hypothetical protein MNBD_CHLOROFLEXI01-2760 [hydrothermal vent metagenome]|uniref:Carbohydrate-binding domain-containing protein n=1 Tax=hydrothermal vent metagenome TaxID=652676 RepID=A0A3B0V1Y4_9ZZZZ
MGIALLFALLVCGGAAYFVWSQFRERTTANEPPLIVLPTTVVTETAVSPTDSPPAIAPTSTLRPSATIIPVGDGNVEAVAFAAPLTIDGDLAEWGGVSAVSSAYRVYSVAGWDGSEDLTAVWQLAWDSSNLYVAVTVTDDVHVQTVSGNEIFRGDSVDMQFDTARDADFGNALSPDDFQITLSPGDFAGSSPSAFRYQGTTGGGILDAAGGNSVTVAAQPVGTGYTLEAAIPWIDLNLTPTVGMIIGIALNASDNDTPGTAVQEVMISHMPNRTLTNPTSWGTLTLR